MKDALANAPVLAHPDFMQPFAVWTDGSIEGVGAVLLQDKRSIAFESAKLSPAERNYAIGLLGEQELLAVIHAFKKWRVYLEGAQNPVRLRTDHHTYKTRTKKCCRCFEQDALLVLVCDHAVAGSTGFRCWYGVFRQSDSGLTN